MKTSLERKRERAGLYFVLPSMTIFTVFVFIPLIIAFIFSFFKFDMMFQNFQFQKLGNYAKLASDKKFWNALFNTVYYTAFTVPVQIGLALVTAVAVKRKGWLSGFFKSVYFIPAICSMTIVSILLLGKTPWFQPNQCFEQSHMGHAYGYSCQRMEKFWF